MIESTQAEASAAKWQATQAEQIQHTGGERMVVMAERISARQVHEQLRSGQGTLLVCAYDSEDKFRQNHLEAAISLQDLQAKAGSMPKDREIIFYCA